jgi:hypothetical protein
MKKPREKMLYPVVEKWIEQHFGCFQTDINKGSLHSHADVIGVRDMGGDLSGEVETIIVEVKRGQEPFATSSGQAFGYNVYANRVYLADVRPKGFTSKELQIANHLGIGLIQIRNKRCHEILSSPYYNPIPRLNLEILENLGVAKCQLCSSFFLAGNPKNIHMNVIAEDVKKAVDNGKGLVFWNEEVASRRKKSKFGLGGYGRRFVCKSCVGNLLAVQVERLKGWFSEFGRGG